MRVQSDPQNIGACGCARSPTGKCNGWHGLSEDEYLVELQLWNKTQANSALTTGIQDSNPITKIEQK